jgi:hypothetical protein
MKSMAVPRRSRGSFAGMILMVLALLLSHVPVLNAAPDVTVIATSTPGRFEFMARGFRANEEVSTWLTGPSQQVASSGIYSANSSGSARFHLRMPRHYQPGRWAITVHGLSSDSEAIGFFVMPVLGPDVTLTVDPPSGPPSATFTFSSTEFDGNEFVSYWLTGPDGKAYPGGIATADNSGTVFFAYTFGPGVEPGLWLMSASGLRSDHLGVVSFTVTRPQSIAASRWQGHSARIGGARVP